MFDKVLLPVEGAAAAEGRLRYVSRQAPGRYAAMWEGRVEATTVMEPYSSRTCRRSGAPCSRLRTFTCLGCGTWLRGLIPPTSSSGPTAGCGAGI